MAVAPDNATVLTSSSQRRLSSIDPSVQCSYVEQFTLSLLDLKILWVIREITVNVLDSVPYTAPAIIRSYKHFFLYTLSILRDFVFLAHFSKEFSAIFWKNCVSDKVIIIRFTDKVGYGRKNQLFERFPCSIYGF